MTRPRRMRRHARKMRRYGLQPMVVINPRDPLPELADRDPGPAAVALPLRTRPARPRRRRRVRRVGPARSRTRAGGQLPVAAAAGVLASCCRRTARPGHPRRALSTR